jgi:hypothetical protein
MSEPVDPVATPLDSLARATLASAPRPIPIAVVRILAERHRAERASRRILAFVVIASAIPVLVLPIAWAFGPMRSGASLSAGAVFALVLGPAIAALVHSVATSAPICLGRGRGTSGRGSLGGLGV